MFGFGLEIMAGRTAGAGILRRTRQVEHLPPEAGIVQGIDRSRQAIFPRGPQSATPRVIGIGCDRRAEPRPGEAGLSSEPPLFRFYGASGQNIALRRPAGTVMKKGCPLNTTFLLSNSFRTGNGPAARFPQSENITCPERLEVGTFFRYPARRMSLCGCFRLSSDRRWITADPTFPS